MYKVSYCKLFLGLPPNDHAGHAGHAGHACRVSGSFKNAAMNFVKNKVPAKTAATFTELLNLLNVEITNADWIAYKSKK